MKQHSLTASVWEAEDRALKRGDDPPPCPRCRRRGFYAPRFAPPFRRYRACKFCGFWQSMDRPAHRIIRYECIRPDHRYADWKEPQEWWRVRSAGRDTHRQTQFRSQFTIALTLGMRRQDPGLSGGTSTTGLVRVSRQLPYLGFLRGPSNKRLKLAARVD